MLLLTYRYVAEESLLNRRFKVFVHLSTSNNFHVFTCMQPKQRTSVITCLRYFKVGYWGRILSLLVLVSNTSSFSYQFCYHLHIVCANGRTNFPFKLVRKYSIFCLFYLSSVLYITSTCRSALLIDIFLAVEITSLSLRYFYHHF